MITIYCKACDKRASDLHPELFICFECFKNHNQPKELNGMNTAQAKVDMIKKIHDFSLLVRGQVAVSKKISQGIEYSRFVIDNGVLVFSFNIGQHYFQMNAYDKLNMKLVHRSQSPLHDHESITYDYETLVEILQILEHI